ncbi:hypothetical protein Bca4012_010505 [Brassica carinata]
MMAESDVIGHDHSPSVVRLRLRMMAREKIGSHLRSNVKEEHLEYLYDHWGDEFDVETLLKINGEILENVRPGYAGAYITYCKDCGLPFPIPAYIHETLAQLGMEFTHLLY